jgi:hypothetical protein
MKTGRLTKGLPFADRLQVLAKRIMFGADGEITDRGMNSPLSIFAVLYKIYLPPEMGKVVRNRSAKGHQFASNRQQMTLSGFCLC